MIAEGRPAPDCVFLGPDDRETRLSDLGSDGPVVLVFLRHFG